MRKNFFTVKVTAPRELPREAAGSQSPRLEGLSHRPPGSSGEGRRAVRLRLSERMSAAGSGAREAGAAPSGRAAQRNAGLRARTAGNGCDAEGPRRRHFAGGRGRALRCGDGLMESGTGQRSGRPRGDCRARLRVRGWSGVCGRSGMELCRAVAAVCSERSLPSLG